MNQLPLILVVLALGLTCSPSLYAQTYSTDDIYRQTERAADAAQENAAATCALLDEQKRANATREAFEAEKLKQEAIKKAEEQLEKFVHDVSSSGDGISKDNPAASKLGWYHCIYIIQNLPSGSLVTDWFPSSISNPTLGKNGTKVAFLEGFYGGENSVKFVAAYQAGTYSYTDKTGNKRVVPRYVIKSDAGLENMKYNYTNGSAKPL